MPRLLRFLSSASYPTAVALLGLFAVSASGADKLRFNRDIRPILSEHCYACHGPDKNQRQAGLRLDERGAALEAGAIEPGKPDASEVVKRIFTDNGDELMPPKEANKPLSAAQKELLKRWISEGAEYEGHWAYLAPVKPAVPAGVAPIDHFVRQELSKRGLKPSVEADRRTLIRRLSFDLVGLPPKPEEVEAFVNDKSPEAYRNLVEKLLASPHFGERMAILWLDVVRYADTIGYHSDTPRNVWPYRDYVIRAFNENKPFDRFVREQIAGDLLADASVETKVGSAFNRLLLTTEEGGAQAKDYEARMLTDRVRAVGTVFLGQTIGCTQCHDHKFDPTSTRDFYAMGAFFADIQEPIIGRREEGMLVPSAEQQAELARLDADLLKIQQDYDAPHAEFNEAQAKWETTAAEDVRRSGLWMPVRPESATSEKGVTLKIEADGTIVTDKNPAGGMDVYRLAWKSKPKGITGLRLEALSQAGLPGNGPGRAGNGNFVVGEITVSLGDRPLDIASASARVFQEMFPASAAVDGKAEKNNGWAIGSGAGRDQSLYLELKEPIDAEGEATLTVTLAQPHGDNHVLGRFRLSTTTQPAPFAIPSQPLPPKDVAAVLALGDDQRTPAQKESLKKHFRATSPEFAALRGRLEQAKGGRTTFEAALPRCIVSVSSTNLRTVRVLPRGNWQDESGEVMQPAFPGFLPGMKPLADRRLTRLDLAEWVVSKDNPLTSRVFVNRIWKHFFGTGLSKTVDDFGAQGEWPSHPELLDWLACEFQGSGVGGQGSGQSDATSPPAPTGGIQPAQRPWDIKQLIRAIVQSDTYRQSSAATKEQIAKDPENRLVARQSRFRLDAELVRDNALVISGLFVPKIGGPSVKPYQPDGYWENLNFPTRIWVADAGENQYRRGLYTWWQRSFLHPSLLAFDAPTREECAADRPRSNIPQQALVLLNDPTYVEAARAFAARILKDGGSDDAARITWAWRQTLQRAPREDEIATVKAVLDKHRAHYAKDTAAAETVLKTGQAPRPADTPATELAAWTSAARILLNLHETITRN